MKSPSNDEDEVHRNSDDGRQLGSEYSEGRHSANPFIIPPKGPVERLKEWRVSGHILSLVDQHMAGCALSIFYFELPALYTAEVVLCQSQQV